MDADTDYFNIIEVIRSQKSWEIANTGEYTIQLFMKMNERERERQTERESEKERKRDEMKTYY